MKAAVVHSSNSSPQYGTFEEPTSKQDQALITVRAAALSPLVRGQTSGRHYSSRTQFPFIPGVDGVGVLPDGRRVYFAFPEPPYGTMAERVTIRDGLHVLVPDGLDDVTAAALANPGMSSWAALTARAQLVLGETVLINGATGTAGGLAVRIAKHLGAGKVIATGRNLARLNTLLGSGADVVIPLEQPEEALARRFKEEIGAGVDVILDYLWGKTAELLLAAASGDGSGAAAPRIRYVEIGASSGPTIALPSSVLRSSGLELLGSGLGSNSHEALVTAIGDLLQAAVPVRLGVEVETVPLTEVEAAWGRDIGERRLVFTL